MIALGGIFLGLAATTRAAEPAPPPPTELRVRGLGWWRDRVMRNELTLLLKDQHRGQTYDANAIEDGAMLILAQLSEEGRLHPRLTIRAFPPGEAPVEWPYQIDASINLPKSWVAEEVEYLVEPGVKYRIAGVEIEGLQALTAREGLAYFQDNSAFAGNPWQREYSPGSLRRMQQQLTQGLLNLGYADATVEATDLRINDQTGEVRLRLRVTEGRPWRVAAVLVEDENHGLIAESITRPYVGRPWCELLDHDLTNEVRNTCYLQGYPDATVQSIREAGPGAADHQPVNLRLRVSPGPQVRRGEVHFEGARQTRLSLLQDWVKLPPGALLDPTVLEETRLDIARLGTFQSVDLSYQPGGEGVRDPVFTLRETQPWETSLLFGYGSYDQLRAGLEIRHYNFLGEAGVGTLKLVQSMKSTRGDLSYSFPQFFGHRLDSHVKAYALRREELQLERREAGLRLAFSRPVKFLGAVATAGYLYEELRYEQAPVQVLTTEPASGDTTAASLEFNLTRDRRDNFIRPREGYHWFVQSELASPSLGGNSEYQRVELGMSYHRPLAQGAWLHVGLTHGLVATWNGSDSELPVNKLFFPGGDNSIRGYAQGEAAPRNPDGTYAGARSYAVLNLETEFALAKNWSVVLFSDSLGEAVEMADYPFDTFLFSVGAGLRYQSIIGPVRMEYGYNLNPRPYDPSGTLLFSLGFPF